MPAALFTFVAAARATLRKLSTLPSGSRASRWHTGMLHRSVMLTLCVWHGRR